MAATVAPEQIDAPPHPRRGRPHDQSASAIAFFVAVGILCLHVLDDNFLQPQPGTDAADHIVSGLVPVAILLGIATVYPRMRAGARAISALTIGLFGVVMGASEAGYYTLARGPSGDDFTGLLRSQPASPSSPSGRSPSGPADGRTTAWPAATFTEWCSQ